MELDLGVFGFYVNEPIGMDHPLWMARAQARIYASQAARDGSTLDEALHTVPPLISDLFGDVPRALVDASITTAYFEAVADLGGQQ